MPELSVIPSAAYITLDYLGTDTVEFLELIKDKIEGDYHTISPLDIILSAPSNTELKYLKSELDYYFQEIIRKEILYSPIWNREIDNVYIRRIINNTDYSQYGIIIKKFEAKKGYYPYHWFRLRKGITSLNN